MRPRQLNDHEDTRNHEVLITIIDGPHKGRRYALPPKQHEACTGRGRVVRNEKVEVCHCLARPIQEELGKGVSYDVDYRSPAERQAEREAVQAETLAAELAQAEAALTDLTRRRDAELERLETDARFERERAANYATASVVAEQAIATARATLDEDVKALEALRKQTAALGRRVDLRRQVLSKEQRALEYNRHEQARAERLAVDLEVRLDVRTKYKWPERLAKALAEVARLRVALEEAQAKAQEVPAVPVSVAEPGPAVEAAAGA